MFGYVFPMYLTKGTALVVSMADHGQHTERKINQDMEGQVLET